jgi:hypothetical protein
MGHGAESKAGQYPRTTGVVECSLGEAEKFEVSARRKDGAFLPLALPLQLIEGGKLGVVLRYLVAEPFLDLAHFSEALFSGLFVRTLSGRDELQPAQFPVFRKLGIKREHAAPKGARVVDGAALVSAQKDAAAMSVLEHHDALSYGQVDEILGFIVEIDVVAATPANQAHRLDSGPVDESSQIAIRDGQQGLTTTAAALSAAKSEQRRINTHVRPYPTKSPSRERPLTRLNDSIVRSPKAILVGASQ